MLEIGNEVNGCTGQAALLARSAAQERGASNRGGQRRTVAMAALSAVVNDVARWVPCVAGGNNMPLIEAAYAVGLVPIHSRSEVGAGFIANGIAWELKRPTLCVAITSVGAFALQQPLYAAAVNHRPLVIVSGEVSGLGRGSVQAGDGWDGPSVTRASRELTAWSADAWTADLAIRGLRRAVSVALEKQAPVHLNIPLNVQKQLVELDR